MAEVWEGDEHKVPKPLEERIRRGRERMQRDSAKRNECWGFYRGEQFYWTNSKRTLVPDTATANADGQRKPPYVNRTTRNLIVDVVNHEVSAATSRVPSYSVAASTSDPEDISAARLAEKVALYGYDKWDIRRATERTVLHAIVGDEGFAWPYFDNTVGPYVDDGIGQGEIRIRTYGANEVYWEPGVSFDESRWFAVEQARDREDVMEMEGYVGGPLNSDAVKAEANKNAQEDSKLVLVTDYLERPCPKYPQGRWLTIANGRQILPERAYPCQDEQGQVLDEPVLHKLSYFLDPDSDRDLGLVRFLVDPQRTINGAVNRFAEWVHLALSPQAIIWNGGLAKGQRLTPEPGVIYNAYGTNGKVEWRPVPNVPPELMQQKTEAEKDMARIAAQNEIPSQVESGKGIQALIEKDAQRRGSFINALAEFHSRLMRHCLYLVQRHYTEDRLVKFQGRIGPDLVPGFRGAQLNGQADVRVNPASLEPQTKEGIQQKVMNLAQMFPGYFPPEVLMSAMDSGTAEKLIQTYELDVARANEVIQQIRLNPDDFLASPMRPVFPNEDAGPKMDPMTGQPVPVTQVDPATGQTVPVTQPDEMGIPQVQYEKATEVPEWMPRPFDGIPVQKAIVEDFCKTRDYSLLTAPGKEAIHLYYSALLDIESRKAQRDAEMQSAMAQDMGMQNAAAPQGQGAKPLPSLPALNGSGEQKPS